MALVVILSILAAMAIPALTGAIERSRLKAAAEAIASDLDLARLDTAKRNVNLAVSFANGSDWCYGVDTASCDCNTADDCAEKSVSASDIGTGVTMGEVAFGANTFTSFNRIRGTATAGRVNLRSDSGSELRVVVSGRGRIRICSPTNDVPGYPSC